MRQAFLMLLFLGFSFVAAAQSLGGEVCLIVVKNNKSNAPIPYSAVEHSRIGLSFQSDFNGRLKLSLMNGDTLKFKTIGFSDTTIVVNHAMLRADSLLVSASPRNYMLKEVEVLSFYSYASFKHRFANLVLAPDKNDPVKINFDINMKEIAALSRAAAGSGVGIGLGGLYGTTKQQKFQRFLAAEAKMERVRALTSHENLGYFTCLKGDSLDSFILFLRSRHQFDSSQSDYEILAYVQSAFAEFQQLNKNP